MQQRFNELIEAQRPPQELLHVAALTQEVSSAFLTSAILTHVSIQALILFTIETLRFKNASVVKVNKLGALVQTFKGIRTEALSVLKGMGTQLVKISENEGTVDKRKAFVEGFKSPEDVQEVCP